MGAASTGRHRRRAHPRLSGTLHIQDRNGHQVTVPLRGRASVLTPNGTGLIGYGEVWAVHTAPASAETSLMITYGPDGAPGSRQSGLCAAGATIELGGVRFTWQQTPPVKVPPVKVPPVKVPPVKVPRPRVEVFPGDRRAQAAKAGNGRAAPDPADAGLAQRLRNMVRVVTQSPRH